MNSQPTDSAALSESLPYEAWQAEWTFLKWNDPKEYYKGNPPQEKLIVPKNALLINGINIMLSRLGGVSVPAYTYSATPADCAHIAVGSGTTAAVSSQTALVSYMTGYEAAVNDTVTVSSNKITWDATFAEGVAEGGAWKEIGIVNARYQDLVAVVAGVALLNRRVGNFGTKALNSVWTVILDVTINSG